MSLFQYLFSVASFFILLYKIDRIKDQLDRIEAKLDKEREGK